MQRERHSLEYDREVEVSDCSLFLRLRYLKVRVVPGADLGLPINTIAAISAVSRMAAMAAIPNVQQQHRVTLNTRRLNPSSITFQI